MILLQASSPFLLARWGVPPEAGQECQACRTWVPQWGGHSCPPGDAMGLPFLRHTCRVGLCLLAWVFLSCTPYSFSGGRTALVKTVAVPVFENETTQFGLAEALTGGIIDGFVADNQVKVADASTAEAVLNGRVLDYQRKAYTFDQNDQVREYLVEIWVAADLVKKDGSGSVWSAASIRGFGDYAADSSETMGQQRAIKKIAEDIINRTVKSW